MDATRQALQDFVSSTASLGPSRGRNELLECLRGISRANARYFNVAASMLVLAFIVALALVYQKGGDKKVVEATVSGFGATIVGMVWMMLRFWREKVRTEMLIELSGLDPAILREVALRFLDSVAPRRDARHPATALPSTPAGHPDPRSK